MAKTAIIVGIDEAGYGPILGPLVVSASAFELPIASATRDLWRELKSCVTQKPSNRDSRVCILDSKKLHKPSEGVHKLERTVLSTIGAWRGVPSTLHDLMRLISPETIERFAEYPWYANSDLTLPRSADGGGVQLASGILKRELESTGNRPAGFWSEVLLEGHYNRLVSGTQNKAVVLLGLTLRLIQRISDDYPDTPIHFYIDKQGARDHYANPLIRAFDGRHLRVIQEDQESSAYEMTRDASSWRISFHQSGESKHLPVALASCVSKYVREVIMECLNNFWARHVPDLKPTAGYYQDGLRFLGDIDERAKALGIERSHLVRSR